ncbi:MAG TPA: DUF4382 domain-containing protein [Flavisolibacter sp.]|nr:DUF4382 domain-containing protein [Flavisolibacter sp.]
MKTRILILSMLSLSLVCFFACKKDASNSTLAIHMTDAPAAFDEVNVDLKEVRVNFDDDSTGWVTLDSYPGIYNLLGLQNGVDSLIAKGDFPVNKTVKEIRLILGTNNTIKANGQIYPLTIPSGSESGLKIKIGKKLRSTLEKVVIDFDADLSVKQENDGYKLKPVIKLK